MRTSYQSNSHVFVREFLNSSIPSVDFFLATRGSEFVNIGKLAIALHILEAESKSRFREETPSAESDWYSTLFHRLIRGFRSFDSFYSQYRSCPVSFVTFNYDRSLEHFLYESVKSSYGEDPRPIMDHLTVHHVYGSLFPLPWQSESENLSYGAQFNFRDVVNATRNIYTVYENAKVTKQTIRDALKRAEKIVFLGFGFAQENLDALSLPSVLLPSQQIFATVLGLSESLKGNVRGIFSNQKKVRIEDTDCKKLLEKYALF